MTDTLSVPRESPRFLNRAKELRQVQAHFSELAKDPSHLAVLEAHGIGGAGKTSLLGELERLALLEGGQRYVVRVSLEGEASKTAIGPLRVLRREVGIDCFLFDAALLTYLDAVGQFHGDGGSEGAEGWLLRAIELGGGLASICLPASFAVDLFRSIRIETKKHLRYERSEFEAIDELRFDPATLRERLPGYLGLDISRRLNATRRSLIVLYDGYEKQADSTLLGKAPWLRKLIATVGRGVHVIATRRPLEWPRDAGLPAIQRVSLDQLPDQDSRKMLRDSLGEIPPEIEAQLLKASSRIPLLLKAAIRTYESRGGDGTIDLADLPDSDESTLEHLFNHLAVEQRRAAVSLAAIQVFDQGLYDYLIRALHLPVSDLEFNEVMLSLFVEEVGDGLFKTHDLLTDAARQSAADFELRKAGLAAASRYLVGRCQVANEKTLSVALALFRAVLDGWNSLETVPTDSVEALVDAAYLLHDAGYWHELASMSVPHEDDPEHPITIVLELFRGLVARRSTGVDRAIELLDALAPRLKILGRRQLSAEVEIAYLNELAGDYRRARVEFEELDRRANPFDPFDRGQLRSRLYHGDMLIMDGHFQEGSRLLADAYEKIGARAPLDWAELVRHRAQAFRFSFMLDDAVDLCEQAIRAAANAPAMVAKLQTNLAELYCWHEPERALEIADLSSEANAGLGSRIELAKCDAIRGIALARLGQLEPAEAVIERAAANAAEVCYPAGVAFALQARTVAHAFAGELQDLASSSAELDRAVAKLDTYRHLRVASAWIAGNDSRFVETAVDVDWLEPEGLEDRLRRYLGS